MEQLLIDVPVGQHARITGTEAGANMDRRLRELGLRLGADVTVTQKTAGGGRVVKVRGTSYALSAQALKHIVVEG